MTLHTEAFELGYLAVPDGGGPGVVVAHDVWGLSEHYRNIARRLASEGCVALAADLYGKLGGVTIQDPGRWMRNLSDADVLATIESAAQYLHFHPAVGTRGVAVVGFCMGGMYALLAGAGIRGIAAVAPFYGILSHSHGLLYDPAGLDPRKKPREPLDAALDVTCPLLGFFGADDPYVPLADIRKLEGRLKGPAQEIKVYEGAGHAFMNDTRPEMYRPEAAADAWTRLVAFLHEHCGSDRQ
jgi:carboxymethylenebutenolidase